MLEGCSSAASVFCFWGHRHYSTSSRSKYNNLTMIVDGILLMVVFSSISLNVAVLSALGVFVAMGLMPTFQGLHDAAM